MYEITICPNCNTRLSGGVDGRMDRISAYFVGIADTKDGICIGHIEWPIGPIDFTQIKFKKLGELNFCPFCGHDLRCGVYKRR